MASMAGYNPSASLLPNAGGTIQAMSGGGGAPMGFNPSVSLLPSAGGDINSYKGGFFDQDIQIIGGDGPAGRSASSPAAVPPGGPPPANVPPAAEAPRVPRKKPAVAPSPPQATGAVPPATTGAVPPAATGAAPPPVADPAAAKPEELKAEEPKADGAKPEDTKAGEAETNAESPKIKKIVLFGKSLDLEDPRKMNSDNLTETQMEALKLFGLDGDRVSQKEKRDVIIALFDGKCNTDKPLIFLQNCEPIRRIVQSLALNLLSHLKNSDGPGLNGVDKEPIVSFQQLDDGSMKVCIHFAKDQLSLLSSFVPKKVSNAAKKAKKANKPGKGEAPAGWRTCWRGK